jgi:hypothetical protein
MNVVRDPHKLREAAEEFRTIAENNVEEDYSSIEVYNYVNKVMRNHAILCEEQADRLETSSHSLCHSRRMLKVRVINGL